MLFNSPIFLVFFIGVFSLYWLLRARTPQNVLLLGASYVFYGAWSIKFLLLLVLTTVVDYTVGRAIASAAEQRRKRAWLVASATINLSVLGFFKYFGFFVQEAAALLKLLGFEAHLLTLQIVLPVGISFYTFQSLSYVVDVYRGKLTAERNLLDYALYVAFFPQLVAGPIERATHLLPQFKRARSFSGAAVESGLLLMVWGLFKKMVIADNLAPYVNAVYGDPSAYSASALITATVFFAFQIYCDFSGYSDTARGTARTLGFDLMVNFDLPYFSRSPVEFWRRWHISLSQWFQDYLYFPLAMRYMRIGGWASKYRAHLVSMGLIGLWHGANWTFIVFGLYWGVVIAAYLYLTERIAESGPGALVHRIAGQAWFVRIRPVLAVSVMFVIVCVGWILFRATSLEHAGDIFAGMFVGQGQSRVLDANVLPAWLLWSLIVGLWLGEFAYRNAPRLLALSLGGERRRLLWRHAMACAIVLAYAVAQQAQVQPFIYFQF